MAGLIRTPRALAILLPSRRRPLLQIRRASSVEDIAAVIGDHVYERFFHSTSTTEAGHYSQEPLGSVPSTAHIPRPPRSLATPGINSAALHGNKRNQHLRVMHTNQNPT